MRATVKKKLNLTVDQNIIEIAHKVAEVRGRSLSSLVEEFLSTLTSEYSFGESNWIDSFQKKYLGNDYKDPKDAEVSLVRQKLLGKYL